MLRAAVVALVMLALAAGPANARVFDDVRAGGVCSKGVAAELRLKSEERGIELRVLSDLHPLRDAVVRSGYRFSMARMANATAS